MGMDQYLLIPFLGGWTSILTQLFWCELQGYKVLTHCHIGIYLFCIKLSICWWEIWWYITYYNIINRVVWTWIHSTTCFSNSVLIFFVHSSSRQAFLELYMMGGGRAAQKCCQLQISSVVDAFRRFGVDAIYFLTMYNYPTDFVQITDVPWCIHLSYTTIRNILKKKTHLYQQQVAPLNNAGSVMNFACATVRNTRWICLARFRFTNALSQAFVHLLFLHVRD
jgi:hypothetical protein